MKCTEMRLAAGLRPNPLGSLERCPGPIREEDRFVVRGDGMREAKLLGYRAVSYTHLTLPTIYSV